MGVHVQGTSVLSQSNQRVSTSPHRSGLAVRRQFLRVLVRSLSEWWRLARVVERALLPPSGGKLQLEMTRGDNWGSCQRSQCASQLTNCVKTVRCVLSLPGISSPVLTRAWLFYLGLVLPRPVTIQAWKYTENCVVKELSSVSLVELKSYSAYRKKRVEITTI